MDILGFAANPVDSEDEDDETTSLLGNEEGGFPLERPVQPGELLFGAESIKEGGDPMFGTDGLAHDYGYKLLDDALHQISGKFQTMLALLCALANFVDASELMMMGLLYPTLQEEWKLNEREIALIGSLTNTGMFVGAIVFGKLSDRFGRQKTFMASMIMCAFFGLVSSFANDVVTFSVLRMFLGIGYGGNLVTSTTLLVEFVCHEWRGVYVMLTGVGFGIGALVIAGVSWAVIPKLGWRWLLRIAAFIAIPPIISLVFVPESPRFYIMRKEFDRCVKSMQKVATINGKVLPSAFNANTLAAVHHEDDHHFTWRNGFGTTLLCRKGILITLVPLALCWFLNAFANVINNWVPIHAQNNFKKVDSVVFEVALIQASGMLIGNLFQLGIVQHVPRLTQLRAGFALSALSVLFLGLFGLSALWALYLIAFLVMFVEQIVIGTLYLYTPEVFPTTVRVSAFGVCQSHHRIAPIIAPYCIAALDNIGFNVTCFVFASLFFVGFLCSLGLQKSTFNEPLIEESDIIVGASNNKKKVTHADVK